MSVDEVMCCFVTDWSLTLLSNYVGPRELISSITAPSRREERIVMLTIIACENLGAILELSL